MTLARLAVELGISRPTLNKYRSEGLPVGDLAACKEWIARHKATENRGGRQPVDRPGAPLIAIKEAKLRAEVAKIEADATLARLKAEEAQRNLVPISEARELIAAILGPLRTLLDALPQSAGPRANPTDPALGEQAIREALDGVFKAMEKARDGGVPRVA